MPTVWISSFSAMRRATSASSTAFWSCSQSRASLACSWVRTRASTTAGWMGLVM
jgi:hypothetical protein